jgi:hypothetical protein
MTTRTYKWTFLIKIDGGHTFWREVNHPNRIAIADESADTMEDYGMPHHTDDGVLWLDQNRPVRLEHRADGIRAAIPLLTEEGEPTMSPVDLKEVAYCVVKLGMRLSIEGMNNVVLVAVAGSTT